MGGRSPELGRLTQEHERCDSIRFAAAILLHPGSTRTAEARDTRYELKIADVMADPRYAQNVPAGIRFYFASQAAPAGQNLGEFVDQSEDQLLRQAG